MLHPHDREPRDTPLVTRAHTSRSWLPMQPHLLVALDPIHWSRRARADQRWQREPVESERR